MSLWVGAIALFKALTDIFFDDQLNKSQKLGQMSLEVLVFLMIFHITKFIGLLFVPPFTVMAAVLVAVSLAVAVAHIKALYFTLLRKLRDTAYA